MDFILRNRRKLLLLVGLLTVFFIIGVFQLQISFSFERFYPKDDPEFLFYESYQERFADEQNYMIYIALESTGETVFDYKFLQRADQAYKKVEGLAGIDSAITATQFQRVKRRGVNFSQEPWLEFDSEEAVQRSAQRIEKDSSMQGILLTHNQKFVCGYFFMDPDIFDTRERDDLSRKIDTVLQASGLEHVISGIPYIRTRYVAKIASELAFFVSASVLFILLVLFLMYRSAWGIIIPEVAVFLGLVWIIGLMGHTGQTIDLINNLLIPIMFVVGMSDVIHLTTKYLSEVRKGKDRESAMRKSLKEIGLSIFLTSLTTAIGFASLMVSRVPPIREFGLYAAIGVLFAFVITVIVLPNFMMRISPEHFLKSKSIENFPIWDRMLMAIYKLVERFPRQVVGVFAILIIGSLLLIFRIPLDNYLIEDIGKRDPIRKSMEFFEENAYGLRPFEMSVSVKDTSRSVLDKEILEELAKVQDFLSAKEEISPFVSAVSFIRQAYMISRNNRQSQYKIPPSQDRIDELVQMTRIRAGDDFLNTLFTEDQKHARLSARMPDVGTGRFEELVSEMDTFIKAEVDTTLFDYHLTGHAYLTENNLQYVRSSLLWGLLIAFIIIGVIMGFLFRSWKMLLISMVPNIIPLIFTAGVMGLFGIALSASTAIVFVIAFGIAVDDTIHFLSRYKLEVEKGVGVEQAIKETTLGTGKAMIMTSLVLLSGFVILLMSDFGGTFNTGLFTGMTIIFALLADLFLLPVLLRWVFDRK